MEELTPKTDKKTSDFYKKYSRIRRKLLSGYLYQVRIALLIGIVAFVLSIFWVSKNILNSTSVGETLKIVNSFLFLPDSTVKKFDDRTNILMLGKSGTGDDSPEITDTIMVATINYKKDSVGLVSIPRDIWVPEIADKINASYKKGNEERQGGGLILAKSIVEEVVGVPIHYAVVFNYQSFTEIIDALGGVEVNVEKGFTDEKFPIPGKENDECDGDLEYKCRYETLVFNPGPQRMDGKTALKYSRSRHSPDLEEGTDLARAARQQLVLTAIKNEIFSTQTLTSPKKISTITRIIRNNVETDMSNVEAGYLARKTLQSKDSIKKAVLPEEFLYNPPYLPEFNYLYVFVPALEGGWQQVHQWFLDTF